MDDIINNIDFEEEVKEVEQRICVGCEEKGSEIHMFKCKVYDPNKEEWVEEIYCNECLSIILIEEPEIISNVEAT